MARNSSTQSNSNGKRGNSQSMMSGWADTAKERPIATAAAVGGAVAAGAFLWSRRNQISDQIGQMSGQRGEASDQRRGSASGIGGRNSTPMGVETRGQPEIAGAGTSSATSPTRSVGGRSGKAQTGPSMSPSRTPNQTPGL